MSVYPDSYEAPPSGPGSPVWELAQWMPRQGSWTVDDYLDLEGPAAEFDQGTIEVLPMPSQSHQLLAQFFFLALHGFVVSRELGSELGSELGRVLMAPIPVQLWEGKFREPDVVFIRADRVTDTAFCKGADLVLEVVSEGTVSRRRDLEIKPNEYAKAGIAEYWLIDPSDQFVRVHRLSDQAYQPDDYRAGQIATSSILSEFQVDVSSWLQAGTQ